MVYFISFYKLDFFLPLNYCYVLKLEVILSLFFYVFNCVGRNETLNLLPYPFWIYYKSSTF